ncbi:MAG: DUF4261 domain-containing protein [Isosphaeraceae bacterium]
MAKGMFTQGMVLLTDGRTTIDDVKAALVQQGLDVVNELPAQEEWAFGGPSLVVPFRPQVNGYAAVDVVDHAWPDAMGDAKANVMEFGAWSMGFFGPLAYPDGLTRARQHAWGWPAGQDVAERHRGFIRIRLRYAFGAGDDAPVIPDEYDPVEELMFLSRVVLALFQAPGVLCYFNPNGEVLRDESSFRQVWDPCVSRQMLPLSLWMNVRFFNLGESLAFMDTVGNGQLDVRDVEAVFPLAEYEPGNVDNYLRNVTYYLLVVGRELQTGEDIDGPGESDLSWTIEVLDDGLAAPPRRVLRLYPRRSSEAVHAALSAIGPPEE